jgi:hypothetical protein
MASYVGEVARGIAFLQSSDRPKTKRFSYRSFIRRGSGCSGRLEKMIETKKGLSDIVEGLEGRKFLEARGYNDLKMGHVLVEGDGPGAKVRIIDFGPFMRKWCFINPAAFSVGMELAQKIPFFGRRDFMFLRKAFFDEYANSLDADPDMDLMESMEVLKRAELLCNSGDVIEEGGVSMKRKLMLKLDARHLEKSLKPYL